MKHIEIEEGAPTIALRVSNDLALFKGDAIIVGVFEEGAFSPAARAIDDATGGLLSSVVEAGDMTGKKDSRALVYTQGRIPAARVFLVGLGDAETADVERLRRASGDSARRLRDLGAKEIGTALHSGASMNAATAGEAISEGSFLALYRFGRHQTANDDPPKSVDSLTLLDPDAETRAALNAGAETGRLVALGGCLARDLANEPPNFLPPLTLAERARLLAEDVGLTCRILTGDELKQGEFNALLAVGQGSQNPPAIIVLEHQAERDEKPLVFVGKGICFDSGGLSLKSGAGMMDMKHDMAGAAAVLGAMRAIGELNVPRRVVGIVAAAENMPSGTAQRPSDIVYSKCGKTIEVKNTDAEGRLVLADALAYAREFAPAGVIDLATLTGAVVTALGKIACGMFGRHDDETDALIAQTQAASEATSERVWRLPLWDEYDEDIKGDVADLQNIGKSGTAGAIVGATFLKAFAEGYPWVHLDIAGMMTANADKGYAVKGATGFGARLLIALARRAAS